MSDVATSPAALVPPLSEERERDLTARRAALADRLRLRGALTDHRWHAAFRAVPRHRFVPWAHLPEPRRSGPFVDTRADTGIGPSPGTHARCAVIRAPSMVWADAVYADIALSTRFELVDRGQDALAPAALARILHALDVAPEDRADQSRGESDEVGEVGEVLEITGPGAGDPGYATALLCHRFGDRRVHRVDFAAHALDVSARLHDLGHHPWLTVTSGAHRAAPAGADGCERERHDERRGGPGDSGRADRLIVTRRVERIRPGWVRAVRDGGVLVAAFDGGIARLHVDIHRHRASGSFLPDRNHLDHGPDADARLWLALLLPEHHRRPAWRRTQEDHVESEYLDPARPDRWRPDRWHRDRHRLDDEVAGALRWWRRLGRPGPERLGITVTPSGQQVWLDDPQAVLHESSAVPARTGPAGGR